MFKQPLKTSHAFSIIALLFIGSIILINYTSKEINLALDVLSTSSQLSQVSAPSGGLVVHYTFDTDASDATGLNNGVVNGATLVDNCFKGSCYNFDGISNNIDVGNGANLNFSQGITVSAWVKPLGKGRAATDYLSIFAKTSTYTLAIREGGVIIFYLPGVKLWVSNAKNKNLFDGVWHHIVATYDGTTQAIYIDGLLIDSVSSTGSITSNTNNLKIGGIQYYKGLIDDLRLYDKGLTSEEITNLYSSYDSSSENPPIDNNPTLPIVNGPKTFYISSSQGNDSNNGLSQGSPWKSLNKIYEQINLPSGIKVGDQILLKRGDTWEGQIVLENLGSKSGEPIVIGAYGSGAKPIIYGDGRGLTWTAVSAYPGVYETNIGLAGYIQRIFENNVMYPHNFAENPYNLTVGQWATRPQGRTDLIWLRTSDGNIPKNTRLFRSAIVTIKNSKNIIIENLDMREVFMAVTVHGSDSIILRDNDTHNTLDISMRFGDSTNNSVMENNNTDVSGHSTLYFAYNSNHNIMRNNIISGSYPVVSGITVPADGDNAAIGLHTGTGNIIEYNTIKTTAIDFFYENDVIIRYNRFISSGAGTWPHGKNITIYGNIGGILGNAVNTGTEPMKIFHNVFVGTRGVFAGQGSGQYAGVNGPIIFKNNIVYNDSSVANAPTVDFGTVVESDNNCFYSTRVRGYKYNGVTYDNFAAYQTASGKDLHSVYGDPKMDINYKLSAGSPCVDIGTDISNQISFPYKDYDGTSIPKKLAPDAGSFESEFTGIPPVFVPFQPGNTPTPGLCSSQVVNTCTVGTSSGISSNSTHNLWTCNGLNGGSATSCSLLKGSTDNLDVDQDGVSNGIDVCPSTSPLRKSTVNKYGCPKPKMSTFDIKPDLESDIRSLINVEIGKIKVGKIKFTGPISLINSVEDQLDIDSNLFFTRNKVVLNSTNLPELNRSAIITLYNISENNPKILKDGLLCAICKIISFDKGVITFTVNGFSTYEVVSGSDSLHSVYNLPKEAIDIEGSNKVNISTTTSNISLTQNLYRGMFHPEVFILQSFLKSTGVLVINAPTGYFGILTEAAVKLFQTKNNITPVSGIVGPKTRGVINPLIGTIKIPLAEITVVLSKGMTHPQVITLQNFLIANGYLNTQATGYFGSLTEVAVKKFQCDKLNICSGTSDTNGYGKVGPKTRMIIK